MRDVAQTASGAIGSQHRQGGGRLTGRHLRPHPRKWPRAGRHDRQEPLDSAVVATAAKAPYTESSRSITNQHDGKAFGLTSAARRYGPRRPSGTTWNRRSRAASATPQARTFTKTMNSFFEQLFAWGWNRVVAKPAHPTNPHSLSLGCLEIDGQPTVTKMIIPQVKRAEHMAILGRTGTGKSSLLRFLASQDIACGRGFLFFDLHGDATSTLLQLLARQEQSSRQDLSNRLIVIEPGDPDFSVGLNALEAGAVQHSFVQIAEVAQLLKQRWHLASFGARTEELLRNSLLLLSENGLTLLELPPLLTDEAFRARCLRTATNSEARDYFAARYNPASEGMQNMFRDAVLNKVSAFTADPHFRHILGQQRSTFSLIDAIDRGYWIILNLDKGRLGEHAATLGSLLLTKVKNALFARRRRQLFTLYCRAVQNRIASDGAIDT